MKVGHGGEFVTPNQRFAIFEERITSLRLFMQRVNLDVVIVRIETVRSLFLTIEPDKDYYMESLYYLRGAYNTIQRGCHDSEADRNQISVYFPKTRQAVEDLLSRDGWRYYERDWKDHKREPVEARLWFAETKPEPAPTSYPEPVKGHVLLTEWKQIEQAFRSDIDNVYVFELNAEDEAFYKHTGQYQIDEAALTRYPAIKKDIEAAGRSFAFGEYTACAFHLGRACEIVMQDLANRRGLKFYFWKGKRRRAPKSWGDFISAIQRELDEGKIRNVEVRAAYSHALASSRKLKKLRNDVDHPSSLESQFFEGEDGRDDVRKIWRETKAFIEYAAQTLGMGADTSLRNLKA